MTVPMTKSPITRTLETRQRRGISANGSWIDCSTFSHSLSWSSSFSELSKRRATATVGTIATNRVTSTRIHFFTRRSKKPAITNCPAYEYIGLFIRDMILIAHIQLPPLWKWYSDMIVATRGCCTKHNLGRSKMIYTKSQVMRLIPVYVPVIVLLWPAASNPIAQI